MGALQKLLTVMSFCWLFRTILIIFLAWQQKKKSQNIQLRIINSPPIQYPLVSILIPAFNEEYSINRCLQSCLACEYSNKEIILIDDGSTDNTATQAETIQHSHPDASINVLRLQTNQGKTIALNIGLQRAKGELIVTLDADTFFSHRDSLLRLISPLIHQQKLTATTANLHVLHTNEMLGMVQEIEYTKFLNTSKRAQSLLKSIMILPGAMSAFRRAALLSIGGFSTRTMAEDADATMELLEQGHLLMFQADCIGITEGPHTIEDLLRQRLRWRIGQMQCLLTHPQLIFISPTKALFYLDLAVMNLISAFTPFVIILLWNIDFSNTLGLLIWLGLGCIVADLGCTAFAFHLDGETVPSPISYFFYLSFFSLFNPIITWISITSLTLQKTTTWHHSARR